jgi:hypothetical protein
MPERRRGERRVGFGTSRASRTGRVHAAFLGCTRLKETARHRKRLRPRVTATGDGNELAYWNRYVAVTQMHGHGTFTEPRLKLDARNAPDQVSSILSALQEYQLSLGAAMSGRYS